MLCLYTHIVRPTWSVIRLIVIVISSVLRLSSDIVISIAFFDRFRLPPPQQQVTVGSLGGGLGSAGNSGTTTVGAQGQAMVMPGFPLRAAAVPHYSPYSPSRFHIDKRCQHRCSWKCFSIVLILLAVALTAMLAYFAGKGNRYIKILLKSYSVRAARIRWFDSGNFFFSIFFSSPSPTLYELTLRQINVWLH